MVIGFAILLLLSTFLPRCYLDWCQRHGSRLGLTSFPNLRRAAGRTRTSAGGVRFRRFLIVFQIALSLMICFSPQVCSHAHLARLKTIDLGFDPTQVYAALQNRPGDERLSASANAIGSSTRSLGRLRTQPVDLTAASYAVVTPVEGSMISLAGHGPEATSERSSDASRQIST